MDLDYWIALLVVPLCLLLLALNAAVDSALTNISRIRLHQLLERGVPRAQALADLLENPRRLPTILLLVNTLALLVLGGLVTRVATGLSHDWVAIPVLILAVLVVLIVGVLVPRSLTRRNPERAALALYSYTRTLQRLISPITSALDVLAAPLARLIGGTAAQPGAFVTEEEMRQLVTVGEEEGVIAAEEEEMITSVFAFGDKSAREVMVPRPDIVAAPEEASLTTVVDLVLEHGYTRIPLYRGNMDQITGVVNAKDLLRALRQGQENVPLRALARPPYFVPETKKVDELLRELQRRRLQLAIVVDEYGGTAGLATLEDLIEEIVGEIQDEYDTEMPLVEELGDNEWRADARLPLDDANELLDTNWQGDDVDTLGGFVYHHLGRIPSVGDALTMDHITIQVAVTEGRRIKQLLLTRERTTPDPSLTDNELLPPPILPEQGGPDTATYDLLLATARTARANAYVPYSHFPVGAAVLTTVAGEERVFSGCNIENASYGLTVCAERTALFSAVAAGARRVVAVAVVAGETSPALPCGACRQALAEFGPGMAVILATADPALPYRVTTLAALFPDPFILTPPTDE